MLDSNDHPAACEICGGSGVVDDCLRGQHPCPDCPKPLRVLSLFAGIGGIDLGLEAHGCKTVAYSEVDTYASSIMARHFPSAVNLGDITAIDWEDVAREHRIDIICGGFPCQDISLAGKGAGIADGTRSGLWANYADAIRVLRPRGVLVENVSALLARGIDRVLGDLASIGFDAEWDCVPAAAVGAPHLRDRVFIIAYRSDPLIADADPHGGRCEVGEERERDSRWQPRGRGTAEQRHDADRLRGPDERRTDTRSAAPNAAIEPQREPADEADALATCGDARVEPRRGGEHAAPDLGRFAHHAGCRRHGTPQGEVRPGWHRPLGSSWWEAEPAVGRVADGIPDRVDRLRCLGNAVVPQVAEHVAGILLDRIEAA